MAYPVINDCWRVALNWRASGGTPANVNNILHFGMLTGDATDLGSGLDSELTSDMFDPMSSAYVLESYDITKLDGTSATVTWSATGLVTGNSSGGVVPEAACSVGFRTNTIGRSARGRAYVGPLVEGVIDGGQINPTQVNNTQDAWVAFGAAIQGLSPAIAHSVASYKLATAYVVSSYSTKAYVATQRRRLVRTRT